MNIQKKIFKRLSVFLLAALLLFIGLFAGEETAAATFPGLMEVDYIDVGQADATLIQLDGHNILIDAGDNATGTYLQDYLQSEGVTSIDLFVITHFHSDHCGGADVIINKFPVDKLMVSDYYVDSASCRNVFSAASSKGLNYRTPSAGETMMVGGMQVTFIAPAYYGYDGPNNSSLGLIVRYGGTSFLFAGDCEATAEAAILSSGQDIDIDVYQVNHHGSNTSSTGAFLAAMSPKYAVISCAEGNTYGHPHSETLNSLRAMGVQVFRTDEQGTIKAYSDGLSILWSDSPSTSWQSGVQTQSDWDTDERGDWEQSLAAGVVPDQGETYYIGNANSKKFHYSYCDSVQKMAEHNKVDLRGCTRDQILSMGYTPCGVCNP